jgi:DNA-binding response OmpR family regulator
MWPQLVVGSQRQVPPGAPTGTGTPSGTRHGSDASALGSVLIVDDDPDTCTTFAAALRLEGLTVRTVHTGADAIAAATAERFDLALIDLRLPDMPGTDVVREVRTAGHDCPFILMSGFLEPPFIVEAMRLGAHDVWPKPVWIEDLCRNVCALVLDRERQRSDSHAPAFQHESRIASKDVSDAGTLAERWPDFRSSRVNMPESPLNSGEDPVGLHHKTGVIG